MFRFKLKLAVRQLKKRRHINFNYYYRARLEALLAAKENYAYHNPGVDKTSAAFLRLLQQEIVICDSKLTLTDYMLLGLVLKHSQCQIRCLILYGVEVFKDEVDPRAFRAQIEDEHEVAVESPLPSARQFSSGNVTPTRSRTSTQVNNLTIITTTSTAPSSRTASPRQYRSGTVAMPGTLSMSISSDDQCKLSFFTALTKSLSLKTIALIEGRYHRHVLQRVFELIQVDNARIVELVVQDLNHFQHDNDDISAPPSPSARLAAMNTKNHKVSINNKHLMIHVGGGNSLLQEALTPRHLKIQIPSRSTSPRSFQASQRPTMPTPTIATTLSVASSRLLLDYFNYSIPGMRSLCLHDCKLSDEHIHHLAPALAVNSSLQVLYLSLNLITDVALAALLRSVWENKNSHLSLLDVSYNLVQLEDAEVLRLLSAYRVSIHPQLIRLQRQFTIDASHNPITKRFDVLAQAVELHMLPQLKLIYEHGPEERRQLVGTTQILANMTELRDSELERGRKHFIRRKQAGRKGKSKGSESESVDTNSLPALPRAHRPSPRGQESVASSRREEEATVLPPLLPQPSLRQLDLGGGKRRKRGSL